MRFGLCCLFKKEPVSFRTTTAKSLLALTRDRQLEKLSEICFHNASNLYLGLETVQRLGIGAFRIMSPLFPRMTHPAVGYHLEDLPEGKNIRQKLKEARIFARNNDIRLSFHPDQFVVLSSPHSQVVEKELYGHISSPRSGWQGGNPKPHADYIDPVDFPACWLGRKMTVDVEAKAKELAVIALIDSIKGHLDAPVP